MSATAPHLNRPQYRLEWTKRIPAELRNLRRWFLWKYELREGKWTKVPYQTRDPSRKAKANKPGTWGTFAGAVTAFREHQGQFDGIGFVFTTEDGLVGVDFDNCLFNGEIAEWACRYIDQLRPTWGEISPSGRGVKFICKAKIADKYLKAGTKKTGRRKTGFGPDRKGAIEVYHTGRYFTVTGEEFTSGLNVIAELQGPINALLEAEFALKPKTERALARSHASSNLDDEALLQKARKAKDGAKFTALFDRGDISGYDNDDSGADEALANLIAFWAGPDANRIERLFNQSALGQREKWRERADYRQSTIELALAGRTEFYRGAGPKVDFRGNGTGHKTADQPPPNPPDPPEEAKQAPPEPPEPINLTDTGNGRRLVRKFGARIRYSTAHQAWFFYDGKRWVQDETRKVYHLAKRAVQDIAREAADTDDEDDRKKILKHALASESRKSIEAMIALAISEPGIAVTPDRWDADKWLLNCQNGTIDLRTGELRPHRKEDFITRLCKVEYDPNATAERWEQFEREIFAKDEDLIGYVRRVIGSSLSADGRRQEIDIFYGLGANGKNVFLDTCRTILADYACTAEPNLLLARKFEAHPTGIADLCGRRLVTASETDDGGQFAEAGLKRLTGDKFIKARFMRGDFFEFQRTFKLILATNHKPKIKGKDIAIWRRIRLVPFKVTFVKPGEPTAPPLVLTEQEGLEQELLEEAPGILKLFVNACLEWQLKGMQPPKAVLTATDDYRKEMDELADFIIERCEVPSPAVRNEVKTKAAALYQAYAEWTRSNGLETLTSREFGAELERRGFALSKSNGVCWRVGIKLSEVTETNTDSADFP